MGEAVKHWTRWGASSVVAAVVGCGSSAPPAASVRHMIAEAEPDTAGGYDSATVARTWAHVDSLIVDQLRAGRSVAAIQAWLTSIDRTTAADTTASDSVQTLVAATAPPFGFLNTIGPLGVGSGADSVLVAVLGWEGFGGPGHLALFALHEGRWTRRYTFSSPRKLWLQGRPLATTQGLVIGMEIFVRADGANARLQAWKVSNGMMSLLPWADTTEVEAGDFLSTSDRIALDAPQYARGLTYGNADPRVEERVFFTVRGDTVFRETVPLNPWMAVVDRFYLAVGRGAMAEARGLVGSESLRRTLWHREMMVRRAEGDTIAGWGTVDLSAVSGGADFRVLVERRAPGEWRITRAVPGKWTGDQLVYPQVTP